MMCFNKQILNFLGICFISLYIRGLGKNLTVPAQNAKIKGFMCQHRTLIVGDFYNIYKCSNSMQFETFFKLKKIDVVPKEAYNDQSPNSVV